MTTAKVVAGEFITPHQLLPTLWAKLACIAKAKARRSPVLKIDVAASGAAKVFVNVVKFSHTNWKHFTAGDPMAFPIVKMENKPPKRPFSLHDGDPHLKQQCLGPLHAPSQTAAPTVEALSHTYSVKSPMVTMARPKFAPKRTHSRGPIPKPHYLPHPWTRPTYKTASGSDPPFLHNALDRQTHRPTHRPTDRSSTGKFDTV